MEYVNNQGHQMQLFWAMRKINTPLSLSLYPLASKKGQEAFGYTNPLSVTWYDNGNVYFDAEEAQTIEDYLKKKIQADVFYPKKMFDKAQDIATAIQAQVIIEDLTMLSAAELLGLFKRERQRLIDMMGFMSYRGSVQMAEALEDLVMPFVRSKYSDICSFALQEVIELVHTPIKPSIVIERKKGLLELAVQSAQCTEDERKELIENFINDFSWVNYHWFIGSDLTYGEVEKEIQGIENPTQELNQLEEDEKEQSAELEKIYAELALTDNEKILVEGLRTWIYARTYIKDCINLAGYKLLPILHALAQKVSITNHDILFLLLDEIDTLDGPSASLDLEKIIKKRQQGYALGIVQDNLYFDVKPPAEFIQKEGNDVMQSEIRGSVAMKGLVRGMVKIILKPEDGVRLEEGDILVTSMTTPDFLPAMKRAAAFVTDEGGITCHAAIVAREMKKPCVTGTKVATKQLHDGELVEVDADNGVVRRI